MEIPSHLTQSVRSGDAVLMLGAGASVGAAKPNGEPAPMTQDLIMLLADKYLGGKLTDAPLHVVSDLAISESSLPAVQETIRQALHEIQPAPFHRLIPTFQWHGLATTNYDLVIERAYQQCNNPSQRVVPLIKDGELIDEKLRSHQDILLLKLHGCITRTTDDSIPLIMSTEQYADHKANRSRVFDHLNIWSSQHPVVFVGHSLHDPDIRKWLSELGSSELRPRFYTVTPSLSAEEIRYWEGRRISPMLGTFEEFLNTLDGELASPFRGVVLPQETEEHTIAERFVVKNPGISPECSEFLENDIDYIRSGMQLTDVDPNAFYRGFSPTWSAVDQELDVRRDVEDTILLKAILAESDPNQPTFFTISGHAGSGKSILLQRIAWESALTYNKLCIYLRPDGRLSPRVFEELVGVINERIYLFVDNIDEHVREVQQLITIAHRSRFGITVIGAARINEWNMSCQSLNPHVTDDFEIKYLSAKEIDQLLHLLDRHKSLFRLEQASPQQRRDAFMKRAGRQLLVALHEATLGKPFEEIVVDEYSQVQPEDAKRIYLGICFLNRFGVDVRAGLVSRVYGVNFNEFNDRFFKPLEGLVFPRFHDRIRDYVYTTRHPHIAHIVVDQVLTTLTDKRDMYIDFIDKMNIDYASDRRAFRRLLRGRSLGEDISDHETVKTIYTAANLRTTGDHYLSHQSALYEMHRDDPDLENAQQLLSLAKSQASHDRTITHSFAELHLKKAQQSRTDLEFRKHIQDAQDIARQLINTYDQSSYGYHTMAKTHVMRVSKLIDDGIVETDNAQFVKAVNQAELFIERSLDKFQADSYLLTAEADLRKLLSDNARAIDALKIAFNIDPQSRFIAIRLAQALLESGDRKAAMDVYSNAIEAGLEDKFVHFNYGKLLIDDNSVNGSEIEYHLGKGFADHDTNFDARFWYARQLYLNGKMEEARAQFKQLSGSDANIFMKRQLQGTIAENGTTTRFAGRMERVFNENGFVIRDGTADRVFVDPRNSDAQVWLRLKNGVRVSFGIGFNYWGATAIDVAPESSGEF